MSFLLQYPKQFSAPFTANLIFYGRCEFMYIHNRCIHIHMHTKNECIYIYMCVYIYLYIKFFRCFNLQYTM